MSIVEIFFSPSGTTKEVAEIIANNFSQEKEICDLLHFKYSKELSSDDVAIIAMPIFAGRLPKTARERFSKIKGNGAKAIAVANYGNAHVTDALLELVDLVKEKGFNVVAAQDLAPELTFEHAGILTKKKPTRADQKNIARAIEVSHTIGAADIGASVVVDNQVIAVEAAEGTARMLDRVVEMRKNRKKTGGVFAKMTKPGQDLRIDIPAIGVDTVNAVADAKLKGIIVNTKTCFVVHKEEVIKIANKRGIFIMAVDE